MEWIEDWTEVGDDETAQQSMEWLLKPSLTVGASAGAPSSLDCAHLQASSRLWDLDFPRK